MAMQQETAADAAGLQRISTEYVEREDRIRLSGERVNDEVVVLWLTQRLSNRLLPHLTGWLAGQVVWNDAADAAHQDILHSFAQQAAQAQLAAEPQQRVSSPHIGWRVDTVDITRSEDALQLVFKGEAQVRLVLAAQPLRQWLGILLTQYQRGEWPTTVWPDWMLDSQLAERPADGVAVIH